MSAATEAFTVVTQEHLARFIADARKRLVVVAPALLDAAADAVVDRLQTLPPDSVSLIFDSEPEASRWETADAHPRSDR